MTTKEEFVIDPLLNKPPNILIPSKGSMIILSPAIDVAGKSIVNQMFINVYLSPRVFDGISNCTSKVFPKAPDHSRVIASAESLKIAISWISKNYAIAEFVFDSSNKKADELKEKKKALSFQVNLPNSYVRS